MQIRREDQSFAFRIDSPGQADPDTLYRFAREICLEPQNAVDQQFDRRRRIRAEWDERPRKQAPIQVNHRDRRLCRVNISGDDHQVFIQAEQRGPASARPACDRALLHPFLFDQLFDDQRNRAAL